MLRNENRGQDGEGEHAGDDGEGYTDAEMDPRFDEHFHADEGKDEGEAYLQVAEEFHDTVDREVEGAQAEDCKDIGGQGDETVAGDREDGGDRIEGENEVGRFDDDEHDEERCGHEFAGFLALDEEVAAVGFIGHGKEAAEEAHGEVVVGIDINFLLARQRHLDAGVDEKGPEDVEHPVEAIDHADPDENEDGPHDHGPNDAPEEHAMLVFGRDLEVGENENEDEDVVHAQAEFDDVGGEKLLGGHGSTPRPDECVKREGQRHPHGTPAKGFLEFHFVGIALKYAEVDREHRGDKREKAGPSPPWEGWKCVYNCEERRHWLARMQEPSVAGQAGSAFLETLRLFPRRDSLGVAPFGRLRPMAETRSGNH